MHSSLNSTTLCLVVNHSSDRRSCTIWLVIRRLHHLRLQHFFIWSAGWSAIIWHVLAFTGTTTVVLYRLIHFTNALLSARYAHTTWFYTRSVKCIIRLRAARPFSKPFFAVQTGDIGRFLQRSRMQRLGLQLFFNRLYHLLAFTGEPAVELYRFIDFTNALLTAVPVTRIPYYAFTGEIAVKFYWLIHFTNNTLLLLCPLSTYPGA